MERREDRARTDGVHPNAPRPRLARSAGDVTSCVRRSRRGSASPNAGTVCGPRASRRTAGSVAFRNRVVPTHRACGRLPRSGRQYVPQTCAGSSGFHDRIRRSGSVGASSVARNIHCPACRLPGRLTRGTPACMISVPLHCPAEGASISAGRQGLSGAIAFPPGPRLTPSPPGTAD